MDDGLRSNARFLVFGFLLAFCSSFGQTFFISLYADQIRVEYSLSHAGFGAYYSFATLLSAAVLLWTGPQIDRCELRAITTVVVIGLALGAALIAYTKIGILLFIALFLLRHCGQGLLSHISSSGTARYFDKRRGRALSLVIVGHAVGEAFLPVVAVSILAVVYWRSSWSHVMVLLVFGLVPLVWWLLHDQPERHRHYEHSLAAAQQPDAIDPVGRQWTRAEVLGDKTFYIVMVALLAPPFIGTGFLFHQVHVAAEKGWTLQWLAASYMSYALLSVAASLVTGVIIDRVGAVRLLPWFLLPLGLSMLSLALFTHPVATWVYMGAMGVCLGVVLPMIVALWAEVYGVKHIGAIRSLGTACAVFASSGSPIVFGFFIDYGISVAALSWWSLLYIGMATGMAVLASRLYLIRCREAPG